MKYKTIFGFSGINRNTSDFLPEDTEYTEAQNLTTDKIGVLKKTGDYEIKGAQITASKDILGGVNFRRADGTSDHLVAIDGTNSDIYYYTGGSWSSQSLSRTSGEKIRFAYSPTLDHLFACNISDDTTGWNGSAWSTSTNLTSAPKAKYPIMFNRRLWLFNADVGGTTYVDRGYRSSQVDSGSITWDTTNDWLSIDDVITGVGIVGENMFIAGQNGCHIYTESGQRYKITMVGCVSHESIASYDTWAFWAARDGLYAFNGGDTQKISLAIQEYWDAIPEANLSEIQAEVLGHHCYVYIGDVTVDGRNLGNVLFDYDILQNDWNRIGLADEVKNLHTYITSSGQRLFMGNDDGEVFQLFASQSQNTASFPSFVETNWFYGSGMRIKDDYHQLWGYGDQLSGLRGSYRVDDGGWEPIGELNGFQDVLKFKTRAYRIKFLLQEESKNNLYELHRLDVGYNPQYIGQKEAE